MKKKFTWLRVVTYINLVLVSLLLLILIVQSIRGLRLGDFTNIASVLFFSFVLLHTILTINIQRRFYPDKLIEKPILVWWRVSTIVSWIVVGLFLLGMIAIFIQVGSTSDMSDTAYMIGYMIGAIIFFVVVAGLIIVQLVGANYLVSAINRNHKLDLENSFL